jgi:hypothetical protein
MLHAQQKVVVQNLSRRKVHGPFWLEVDNRKRTVRLLRQTKKPVAAAKGSRFTYVRVPSDTLAPQGQVAVQVHFGANS